MLAICEYVTCLAMLCRTGYTELEINFSLVIKFCRFCQNILAFRFTIENSTFCKIIIYEPTKRCKQGIPCTWRSHDTTYMRLQIAIKRKPFAHKENMKWGVLRRPTDPTIISENKDYWSSSIGIRQSYELEVQM